MKQFMRIAFVGLLAISTAVHAEGGKPKHKAKAKARQECPTSCPKSQCDKAKCAQMVDCTQVTCTKK